MFEWNGKAPDARRSLLEALVRSRRASGGPESGAERDFPPSGAEIGRSDCELTDTGLLFGEEPAPTGLRLGEEPEMAVLGLRVLPGVEIRRSPLAEAVEPEILGEGRAPPDSGRIDGLETPGAERPVVAGASAAAERDARSEVARLRPPIPQVPLVVARSSLARLWMAWMSSESFSLSLRRCSTVVRSDSASADC